MSVVGTRPSHVAALQQQHEVDELKALVGRAKEDADAFAALYRKYVAVVHGYAFRRSGSREVAEDVTSATFERVWRALPGFEWKGGGFEPWLFRIAATEIAGHYRRAGRIDRQRVQVALWDAAAGAARANGGAGAGVDACAGLGGDADGELDEVRAALSRLRPRYQEAISLRYLAGLSHEEAAEAMGCTKAVMAVTLHRATAALRRELQANREGRA